MTRRQNKIAARQARRARRLKRPHGPATGFRRKIDRRSIIIGVVGALLLHVCLILFGPRLEDVMMTHGDATWTRSEARSPTFDIEMFPDDYFQPPEPPPQKFVEINPDAPDNPPDRTNQFSSQNQQVAQEVPDPDADPANESPASKSDQEEAPDSTAIVSGNRQEPAPPVIAPPPTPDEAPPDTPEEQFTTDPSLAHASSAEAVDPLAGIEADMGDNENGIGTNVVKLPENPRPVDEKVEGAKENFDPRATPNATPGPAVYYRPDPNAPKARPQLAGSQLRPAFIANNVNGTANMGVIAHNALKTAYGEYLNRIIDTVDIKWNMDIREKLESRVSFPLDGSRVKVEFILHKDGTVTIGTVDGSAGLLWNRVAVEAIAARSPYGKWTDDMIAILGDQTPITFTFHY